MAQLSRLKDQAGAIFQAIYDYDELGEEQFLSQHEFRGPFEVIVEYEGRRYPSRPIIGVAYQIASGEPLDRDNYDGAKKAALKYLVPIGFRLIKNEISTASFEANSVPSELDSTDFDPQYDEDERRRINREIVQRPGQRKFKVGLLAAYNAKCAISGYDCVYSLEAAHILPYRNDEMNHITNGILLRRDIHALFDLSKIAIHEDTWTVLLTKDLRRTSYLPLHETQFALPSNRALYPDVEALRKHRIKTGL